MNTRRHEWSHARSRILDRMTELRMSKADLARATDLTPKQVGRILSEAHSVEPRVSTRWAIADALHWTPGSIDLILDGEEPVEDGSKVPSGEHLDQINARLTQMEELLRPALIEVRHQHEEMEKFYRLHQQLAGDVAENVEALRRRLSVAESALEELRRDASPGDAEQS